MVELPESWFKGIITAIVGTFLTFASWFGRRQVTRIDDIQEKKLDKEVFNEALKSLRQDFKDAKSEISKVGERMDNNIRGVHDRIDRFLDK